MFCSTCGAQQAADSAFCANCGASHQPVAQAQPVAGSSTVGKSAANFLKTKNGRIAAIAVGAVLLVGVVVAVTGGGGPNLNSALSNCGLTADDEGVTLGDGGKSLFLDGEGEEDYSGISYSDQGCVLGELNIPDIVSTQISNTTALMGVQDADWDGLHAEWTYHPDNGLEISINKG